MDADDHGIGPRTGCETKSYRRNCISRHSGTAVINLPLSVCLCENCRRLQRVTAGIVRRDVNMIASCADNQPRFVRERDRCRHRCHINVSPLLKYRWPYKSFPIIGLPPSRQKKSSPGRQFTGKNQSRPDGRRAGRILAGKLSAGGDFSGG